MINLESFIKDEVIIGYCTVDELNAKRIYVEAFNKGYAKTPKDYLQCSKTIIVIGSPVGFSEDVYNRNVFNRTYPGYGKVFGISKEIESYLQSQGYKAKVAHNISQKSAAVQAGLGVWGKNALVLNEKYGTHLRIDTVVTDWIPKEYSKPLNQDLCKDCIDCINSCPYNCLIPYEVNAKKCFNKYLKKTELSLEIPMCPICQKACKYNNYL